MDRGHVILPEYGYGFFSNFLRILIFLDYVDKLDYEPWVDWRNTAFVEGYDPFRDTHPPPNPENPWDWWFDQPLLDGELIKMDCNCGYFDYGTPYWKRSGLERLRFINEKYIKIKKHIIDKINEIYNNEFKGQCVLGVMARGCEYNIYHPEFGNQTIESWIRETEEVLNKHTIDKIFVVTEDSNYLPAFNKFNNVLYLKDVFRRTNETLEYMLEYPQWYCIDTKRQNHCRLLGEECIIQASLLSKCDYLVVKHSGVANVAIFWAKDNLKDVFYAV